MNRDTSLAVEIMVNGREKVTVRLDSFFIYSFIRHCLFVYRKTVDHCTTSHPPPLFTIGLLRKVFHNVYILGSP